MTKRDQINAGLALSRAFMVKYHFKYLTLEVIALWCGCSKQNIEQIQNRGLRKLRRYGLFTRNDLDYHCRIASKSYRTITP